MILIEIINEEFDYFFTNNGLFLIEVEKVKIMSLEKNSNVLLNLKYLVARKS